MGNFRNGARVSNRDRLEARRHSLHVVQSVSEHQRPPSSPEALALCRMHPNKGWSKRYLRARGLQS